MSKPYAQRYSWTGANELGRLVFLDPLEVDEDIRFHGSRPPVPVTGEVGEVEGDRGTAIGSAASLLLDGRIGEEDPDTFRPDENLVT